MGRVRLGIGRAPPPGKQTHVLLEPTSSPHLVDLVRRVRALGDVVVHFDSAVSRRTAWAGAKLAFGRVVEPRYDFSRADVVVSLDADFLSGAPQSPRMDPGVGVATHASTARAIR